MPRGHDLVWEPKLFDISLAAQGLCMTLRHTKPSPFCYPQLSDKPYLSSTALRDLLMKKHKELAEYWYVLVLKALQREG